MASLLDIGSQLTAARRTRGMSQRELGAALGVKQQQIARWEATLYRTASLERVAIAAEALEVSVGSPAQSLLVAEALAIYAAGGVFAASPAVKPVRDLGEIAARIREHGAELRDEWGLGRIGVFGSFALGEQTVSSDVDLLVEIADPDKVRGFRFVEAPRVIEEFLGRKVDFAQPHLLKGRLRPRVLEEVVYVWEAR